MRFFGILGAISLALALPNTFTETTHQNQSVGNVLEDQSVNDVGQEIITTAPIINSSNVEEVYNRLEICASTDVNASITNAASLPKTDAVTSPNHNTANVSQGLSLRGFTCNSSTLTFDNWVQNMKNIVITLTSITNSMMSLIGQAMRGVQNSFSVLRARGIPTPASSNDTMKSLVRQPMKGIAERFSGFWARVTTNLTTFFKPMLSPIQSIVWLTNKAMKRHAAAYWARKKLILLVSVLMRLLGIPNHDAPLLILVFLIGEAAMHGLAF